MRRFISLSFVAALVLAFCGGSAAANGAPVVSFVGSQLDLTAWRTAASASLDANSDNRYGTDGYYIFAEGTSQNFGPNAGNTMITLPSYISSINKSNPATNLATGYGYAGIENPTGPGSIFPGTITDPTGDKLTILVGNGAPASFRLTVMVDNLNGTGYNADGLMVTNTPLIGAPSSASIIPGVGNNTPDWYVFEISGATLGDQIVIHATQGDAGTATFALVAFDAIPTPEPSTLALLGLGAIGLLRQACRRKRVE